MSRMFIGVAFCCAIMAASPLLAAKPNVSDEPAIIEAAQSGNLTAVSNLLNSNPSSAKATDERGFTPLHYAATKEIAEALVDKGADLNAQSKTNGWTPLHRACYSNNPDVALFLIDKGANVNIKDKIQNPPLHYAAGWCDDVSVLSAMLAKGADINATDKAGWSALHHAVYSRKLPAVELLAAKGANVNIRDKFGDTPLDIAYDAGNTKIGEVLKAAGGKR